MEGSAISEVHLFSPAVPRSSREFFASRVGECLGSLAAAPENNHDRHAIAAMRLCATGLAALEGLMWRLETSFRFKTSLGVFLYTRLPCLRLDSSIRGAVLGVLGGIDVSPDRWTLCGLVSEL